MLSIPFPQIDPIALQIGPLAIRWYSLAYIAGIVLAWIYTKRLCKSWRSSITAEHLGDFVVWATIGIILGGRLGYVFFYSFEHYLSDPLQILAIWGGGMSFHGGLTGVIVAVWLFSRKRNLPLLTLGDMIACAAPIGLFLGRLANFVNGELYGRVTEVPWAMVFPNGGPLPRHPSQLYEAFFEGLVLFLLLAALARYPWARQRPGFLIGVFLTGYGLARFLLEWVREPDAQLGFLLGSWTMGQLLSAPLILLGGCFLFWAWRSPTPRQSDQIST